MSLGRALREKYEVAKAQALATASRVQEKYLTEENKEKVWQMVEKIGTVVEELVEETNPLGKDNELLREVMDLTYVTDRFIAMRFPSEGRPGRGSQQQHHQCNRISAVAAHLKRYHEGQYMVLNVSEESYDYSWFEEQVLEYKFPGQPAPPLGMLFKMCASVESWIEADPQNVIAVHCLTGRGRTTVVLACAMTWLGLFETTFEALAYVARRREDDVQRLTIPSQRRYAQYFANVLDGVAPRAEPVVLRRAIMSSAPRFEQGRGCCPYLQFFKEGKLAYTATKFATDREQELDLGPAWAAPDDGPLVFHIDCLVHGDVLLRCRHLSDDGSRASMFRAALHAGYAPLGVLRLAKAQLDGACSDDRFPHDFFLDLIFEAAAPNRPDDAAALDAQPPSYDALLHKDSRFWSEVRARKRRAAEKRARLLGDPDPAPASPLTSGFAIGADLDQPSGPAGGKNPPPATRHTEDTIATDDLLEQLEEADAFFAANDDEQAAPAETAPDDVDLLDAELAAAASDGDDPPRPDNANFDIDDFENYLNQLGDSQPPDS